MRCSQAISDSGDLPDARPPARDSSKGQLFFFQDDRCLLIVIMICGGFWTLELVWPVAFPGVLTRLLRDFVRSMLDLFESLMHRITWKYLDELVVDAEDVVVNERAEWDVLADMEV